VAVVSFIGVAVLLLMMAAATVKPWPAFFGAGRLLLAERWV
jgi:hypothetical protein